MIVYPGLDDQNSKGLDPALIDKAIAIEKKVGKLNIVHDSTTTSSAILVFKLSKLKIVVMHIK